MYKITVQSYSKDTSDLFLAENIKTLRPHSGLTLIVKPVNLDKEISLFTDYKGQYNPYKDSMVFNDVSCTDEFKEWQGYDSNALSRVEVEYIRQ